jgi:hypothetical protein
MDRAVKMEEKQLDDVAQLRQELRQGREADGRFRKTGQSGENPFGDGRFTSSQDGSRLEVPRKYIKKLERDAEITGNVDSGTQSKPKRDRSKYRRSSDNDISTSDGNGRPESSPAARSHVGGIERADPIPERFEDLPGQPGEKKEQPQKSRLEQAVESGVRLKKQFFRAGKILSEQEAKNLLEPLTQAIMDYGDYGDQYLRGQTHDPTVIIWGDLTLLEAGTLARILIRRGQRNAAAAELVRGMINGLDYISAAIIVVPRVMRTADTLQRLPKKRRRGAPGA